MSNIDGGLRKLFIQHIPKFMWQPIETGSIARGVPDANYCHHGCEGWVEHKKVQLNRIELDAHQIGWIIERTRQGGRITIAVRYILEQSDMLILFDGKLVDTEFKSKHITDCFPYALNYWNGGPFGWRWDQVTETLLRKVT